MRYEEKFDLPIGKTEKESTVPMTHFQYKEYLKGLGMTPVAAEARLNRKLLDPETIHDKCPESELPTIGVSKGKETENFKTKGRGQAAIRGQKEIKNPGEDDMTELTDMLGMDAPSLSQRTRFDAFDSTRGSMSQLLHGAPSGLDDEFWTADGVQAAIDGPPKDDKSTDGSTAKAILSEFCIVADGAEARNSVRKDFTDLVALAEKTKEETDKVCFSIEGNESYYEDTLPFVKRRLALLTACLAGDKELKAAKSNCGTSKEGNTNIEAFTELKSVAEIGDAWKTIGTNETTLKMLQESKATFQSACLNPVTALINSILRVRKQVETTLKHRETEIKASAARAEAARKKELDSASAVRDQFSRRGRKDVPTALPPYGSVTSKMPATQSCLYSIFRLIGRRGWIWSLRGWWCRATRSLTLFRSHP